MSPANATQVVSPAQKNVAGCGLLSELCALLMSPGVPADILSEIICTVGESIRGCRSNQEFFGQVMASSSPPRTALVVLLMSMVNEKQPVPLRAAVLYCFECFLYKNDVGQGQIIQALLPTSAEGESNPARESVYIYISNRHGNIKPSFLFCFFLIIINSNATNFSWPIIVRWTVLN